MPSCAPKCALRMSQDNVRAEGRPQAVETLPYVPITPIKTTQRLLTQPPEKADILCFSHRMICAGLRKSVAASRAEVGFLQRGPAGRR